MSSMKKLLTASFLVLTAACFADEPKPAAERVDSQRIPLWNGRAPTGDGQFQEGEAWITVHRPAGKAPSPKLVELFSNEKQVTARTPPTFLAHAQDDKPVPPEHSQTFYDALQAHKIPSQYLKLQSGGHGLNGYKGPMWDAWQEKSLAWLAQLKFIPSETATGK